MGLTKLSGRSQDGTGDDRKQPSGASPGNSASSPTNHDNTALCGPLDSSAVGFQRAVAEYGPHPPTASRQVPPSPQQGRAFQAPANSLPRRRERVGVGLYATECSLPSSRVTMRSRRPASSKLWVAISAARLLARTISIKLSMTLVAVV